LMLIVAVATAALPKIVKESKDGEFYLIVDGGSQKELNWMKAEQECQALNMHLASIHNANEANIVGKLCEASTEDRDVDEWDNCWIGGFMDASRRFNWIDRTPMDYTLWQANEPNNGGHVEYCVGLERANNPKYGWNDLSCYNAPVGSEGVAKAVCRKSKT